MLSSEGRSPPGVSQGNIKSNHLIHLCEVIFLHKIGFLRRLKRALGGCRINGRIVLICVFLVLFFGLLSRFLCRPPYLTLKMLGLDKISPPAWVMSLVWTIWYALVGFCLGAVLSCDTPGKQVHVYKGSMYLIVSLVFNLVWYPLFFGGNVIFLAFWNCLVIIFFTLLAAFEYAKVYFFAGLCMFIHIIWLIYCAFLNALALFC